ncbi:MAG: pantoate--beta-alanine ligase, partial [Actinomycetota bacterium]
MKVVRTAAELRAELAPERRAGRTIGFVPTMGALHEAHLSLVRSARDTSDVVVVSIFVNPLQFLPHEDLASYPRDEERDLELAENEKVNVVFLPSVEEMYPEDRATLVHVDGVTERFEGASRPGHFDGVATVVAKLFGLVQPDTVFFGQKDAQQLAVVKRMVADLSLPVSIVACPIVRESDGLALSSRNAYLSPDERARATVLFKALNAGRDAYVAGGRDDAVAAMETTAATEPEVFL